ncbi:alpha/beta fold hydrolase [Bradyrhizobium rifense]|uniref:Alpha/beta fold hydrolase n=1 Tax=Bradyrhizobium rifense TaxID=515499 RepID=A0A5D3KN19_9BRAD|nr:alpha/beta fold hydrolase [Bradyrhizobium rifense]TYL95948.1 alpha/beta fold hydrolase [Bradyrhizobium rifense]
MDFQSLAADYEQNWATLEVRPMRINEVMTIAAKAIKNKSVYQKIEARTDVPWWFVALVHHREANFNFDVYLGNGQPLHQVTTLVPKGRGPFPSFVDGAVDALRLQQLGGKTDWGVARALFRLEALNGFGYHRRGIRSPYLYGGSHLYGPPEAKAGKILADGTFDPNAIDPQIGAAVVLRALMELDSSINLDPSTADTKLHEEGAASHQAQSPSASNNADSTEQLIDNLVSLIESDPDDASGALNSVRAKFRSDGVKEVQEVFFATNRKVNPSVPFGLAAITADRDTQLKYGYALVGIPMLHLIGAIERPQARLFGMDEERPDRHFSILRLADLAENRFFRALSSDQAAALVFVHGYNTSFANAIFRASQIAYDANFSGKVVVFSWPSRAAIVDYDYDRDSAAGSAVGLLLSLLKDLKTKAKVQNVFLVAHSMGSQIAVEALRRAALSHEHLNVRELILAAPDIDRDVFASSAESIKQAAEGITIYASSADKALQVSKFKAGGIARLGDVPEAGPLVIKGIDLIDVTAIGDDMLALTLERGVFRKLAVKLKANLLNHSIFSDKRSALDDLGRIITSRQRPPHERTPTLERMPDRSSPPEYWRYPY